MVRAGSVRDSMIPSVDQTVDDAPLIEPSRRYRSDRLSPTQGPPSVSALSGCLSRANVDARRDREAGPRVHRECHERPRGASASRVSRRLEAADTALRSLEAEAGE